MSLHAFQLLSPVVQLYWVIHRGTYTYLANRWDDERRVNACHYASDGRDLLVEVGS